MYKFLVTYVIVRRHLAASHCKRRQATAGKTGPAFDSKRCDVEEPSSCSLLKMATVVGGPVGKHNRVQSRCEFHHFAYRSTKDAVQAGK